MIVRDMVILQGYFERYEHKVNECVKLVDPEIIAEMMEKSKASDENENESHYLAYARVTYHETLFISFTHIV